MIMIINVKKIVFLGFVSLKKPNRIEPKQHHMWFFFLFLFSDFSVQELAGQK